MPTFIVELENTRLDARLRKNPPGLLRTGQVEHVAISQELYEVLTNIVAPKVPVISNLRRIADVYEFRVHYKNITYECHWPEGANRSNLKGLETLNFMTRDAIIEMAHIEIAKTNQPLGDRCITILEECCCHPKCFSEQIRKTEWLGPCIGLAALILGIIALILQVLR